MFCPKCAAQNADDAKFCRACGADISLVSQAVSGQLAERLDTGGGETCAPLAPMMGGGKHQPPTIDKAVRSLFMSAAFVFIAFAVRTWLPGGSNWWFWMFIPAFVFLGDGVGTYLRLRQNERRQAPAARFAPAQTTSLNQPPRASALPPRDTGEMVQQPASVTEATTRHLGVPVERGPKDV
ncbi:MAG TPA: zinc ribbon domain-containing protein [Pyrinomonadaceae bacterium]|nr:zinc ribbon domain-containing protein [Pyrinomonadaceae bacterium]